MHALTRRKILRGVTAAIISAGSLVTLGAGTRDDGRKVADITGYWKTGSGAVYQFLIERNHIIALYHEPSKSQIDAGIKAGDLAYKGTIVNKVLAGSFYQAFALEDQKKCPSYRGVQPTTLYLQVSDDLNKMEGDLLLEHLADNCEIDDRRIDRLVFERFDPRIG